LPTFGNNALAIYRHKGQCDLRSARMGIYDKEITGKFGFQVTGSWTVEVFQAETGSMYQLGKKFAFGDAVGIQMGVTGDSFT